LVVWKAKSQDEITCIRTDFKTGIRKNKMGFKAGMLSRKARDGWRDIAPAEVDRYTDTQKTACCAAARCNLGFRVANLLEDRAAPLVEKQAFVGQLETARSAICELDTEPRFESCQSTTDGRRRRVERKGRGRDTTGIDDGAKKGKVGNRAQPRLLPRNGTKRRIIS
jgi:hypothetical protein